MIKLDGGKNVEIKKCGVVTYDEDYHKRDLEAYRKIVPPRITTLPGVSGTP